MHIKLLMAVLLLALSGLACSAPQQAPLPAGDASQPKAGGTFLTPSVDDPFDYDMSYSGSSNINATFIKLGYSYLMRLKTGKDIGVTTAVIEPDLATSWEVSPDASAYTFHLRKGVKFPNVAPVNGRELTAADVKWSFEYMSRTGALKDAGLPAGQFAFMFEGMQSIATPDPYTVVVKFKEGFAPFLTYAASSDNVIMPKEIYTADGDFKQKLIGTGPFQPDFTNSQTGSSWTLKKNPSYYQEGMPYLDAMKIFIIKDAATQAAAFQTKQIDYIVSLDSGVADQLRLANPNAVEYDLSTPPNLLNVNLKTPPFDNLTVRKAISMSIDRDEGIKVLQGGKGGWSTAFSNSFADLFTQQEIKSFVKFDQAEARRLLQSTNLPMPIKAEMIFDPASQGVGPAAELLQAQLKKVGIELTLKQVTTNEATARRRAKQFETLLMTEASRADLDSSLSLAVLPTGAFNYMSIDDPKVNQLLVAQRKEVDVAKRREILRQIVRQLNETGLAIPLWQRTQYIFTQPHIQGWYHQADYRTIGSVWNTWINK